MTRRQNNAAELADLEAALGACTVAPPPAGLRERVLERAAKPAPLPRSEIALRWAIAALVVTMAWADWQERQTAERMAAVARVETRPIEPKPHTWKTALLNPRVTLPLPEGYASVRIARRVSSLPSLNEPRRKPI